MGSRTQQKKKRDLIVFQRVHRRPELAEQKEKKNSRKLSNSGLDVNIITNGFLLGVNFTVI